MSKRSRPSNVGSKAAPPAKKIKLAEKPVKKVNNNSKTVEKAVEKKAVVVKKDFLHDDSDEDIVQDVDLSSDDELQMLDDIAPDLDEVEIKEEEEILDGDDNEDDDDDDDDEDDDEKVKPVSIKKEEQEDEEDSQTTDTATPTTKYSGRKEVFFVGGDNATPVETRVSESILDTSISFASFNLDSRLLKAIIKVGYQNPTLVQSASIPLALEGKDILARARTGSGKTAAYLLPILQILLQSQEDASSSSDVSSSSSSSSSSISAVTASAGTKVLILVPTNELVNQTKLVLQQLTRFCPNISSLALSRTIPVQLQKQKLAELPDIVISTPSQLLPHLQKKNLVVNQTLKALVLDEADLLLNFGYAEDIKQILPEVPSFCQKFMMSATLPEELEELKRLVLNNPAILRLEETAESKEALTQHSIKCSFNDRFLIMYAILKLKLIKGKCLIFTNNTDNCFRLKLFLERFYITAAVLNSELPLNSRLNIIQQFNKGIFDYLIATDDTSLFSDDQPGKKFTKKDREFGVARGVDFKGVKAVFNFDLPETAENYVHRIGRTARGGATGIAITFVTPDEWDLMDTIENSVKEHGYEIKPYAFNLRAIDKFRYRVEDQMRSVTKIAVRDARIREIKSELLNSDKLEAHFEDNPKDLELIKHDRALQVGRQNKSLKFLPSYLMPGVAKPSVSAANDSSTVAARKHVFRDDPLRTFRFGGSDLPSMGAKAHKGKRKYGHGKGHGKGKGRATTRSKRT